ncbi:MAG TPA: peptidylprolyl isomerase [Syntrophomonadaceae bacterium]|nr:peptidylprolyl isomerase [Syntrophomonadaceae bacterium]
MKNKKGAILMGREKTKKKHKRSASSWDWLFWLIAVAVSLIICIAVYESHNNTSSPKQVQQAATTQQPNSDINSVQQRSNKYTSPPKMSINTGKQYSAVVTTDLGTFKIKLLSKDAPVTVNNFVFLANDGFYNGITFHRIIKDFMIQTGDPLGNGTGGPGYKFNDELPSKLSYAPGIVAMANSGSNTNGSQFFICTGEQASGLNNNPNYTVFGQVVDGIDVVLKIANTPVQANSMGESSKPTESISIDKITIEEQ